MATQAQVVTSAERIGFVIPTELAEFPINPSTDLRLTREQEQAFGFKIMQLTLDQMQAFACDREVVSQMLNDVEGAFTKLMVCGYATALCQAQSSLILHASGLHGFVQD